MERISPAVILKNTKQGIRKMQEIKIVVDGKEYVKTKYTGEDWLHMLDYIEGAGDQVTGKEFFNARYKFMSDVMKIPEDKLLKADLEEVTQAFRTIEKSLSEAFFGTPVLQSEPEETTQENNS